VQFTRLGQGVIEHKETMKPHIDKYFKYISLRPPPIEEHEVLITFQGKCYIARSVAEWKRQYLNEKGELREDSRQSA
jgi:hypothetical protein